MCSAAAAVCCWASRRCILSRCIEFDKDNPYAVAENANRRVCYAEKREIIDGIVKKYHPDWLEKKAAKTPAGDGIAQIESQSNEPQRTSPWKSGKTKTGGSSLRTAPERKPTEALAEPMITEQDEIKHEPS